MKALPCPFCGSKNSSYCMVENDPCIVCDSCGAVGPSFAGEKSSVENWNKRASQNTVDGIKPIPKKQKKVTDG